MMIKDEEIGLDWSRPLFFIFGLSRAILEGNSIVSDHVGTIVGLELIKVQNKTIDIEAASLVLLYHEWALIDTDFPGFIIFWLLDQIDEFDIGVGKYHVRLNFSTDFLLWVRGIRIFVDGCLILFLILLLVCNDHKILPVTGLQVFDRRFQNICWVFLTVRFAVFYLLAKILASEKLHPCFGNVLILIDDRITIFFQVDVTEICGLYAAFLLIFLYLDLYSFVNVGLLNLFLYRGIAQQIYEGDRQ